MSYSTAQHGNARRASFIVVAGAHAAIITALLLIPPAIGVRFVPETGIPTIEILPEPDTRPPPPSSSEPKPSSPIHMPDRVITEPLPSDPAPFATTSDYPVDPPPFLPGSGTGITEAPVKPHVPVKIGPKPDPRFGDAFQPDYPVGKLRREIEGMVRVRVLVGTDGRVKQVEQLSATDSDFWETTRRQALRKWRFLPATEDGRKVERWHELTVRFELTS
ncbi:MAG: TonB family protein [Blastomonas sp.]